MLKLNMEVSLLVLLYDFFFGNGRSYHSQPSLGAGSGELKLDAISGVYIDGVNKNGAADKVGIRSSDVIIEIDNKKNEYKF
jgi:S1-C subfamily serine protease